jgi:hypothetical protein
MKLLTIVMTFGLWFAHSRALAGEATPNDADGMKIAEELLLENDASQPLPAKEEKVEEKKRAADENLPEAPLVAEEIQSEDVTADPASTSAPSQVLQAIAADEPPAPKAANGGLDYEMETVGMLADAPAAESVAKR